MDVGYISQTMLILCVFPCTVSLFNDVYIITEHLEPACWITCLVWLLFHWLECFSYGVCFLSLQMFLIALSLPLYAVHTVNQPLNMWDLVATVVCLCGIVIAYFADTQLYEFVSRNNKLKGLGKPVVFVLDSGLWYYCRHPNYFGMLSHLVCA